MLFAHLPRGTKALAVLGASSAMVMFVFISLFLNLFQVAFLQAAGFSLVRYIPISGSAINVEQY